jgi:hypothetical protein
MSALASLQAGSVLSYLKIMPTDAAPAAPIPVHTA